MDDEDKYCVAEEQIIDLDDWFDATVDKFKAGSFMTLKTGSDDEKSF